jgi:uncharacterized protein YhaN
MVADCAQGVFKKDDVVALTLEYFQKIDMPVLVVNASSTFMPMTELPR